MDVARPSSSIAPRRSSRPLAVRAETTPGRRRDRRRAPGRSCRPRCSTVAAAAAGVLRRRLQLRRDVPRHPGPGDPTTAATSTERPPTASRRSCPTSTPRRSRSSAPPGCGRCASSPCSRSPLTALLLALEARRRYGRRAMWIAGLLLVVVAGGVRPAGRSGRQLRDLHAAGDGRGRCCSRAAGTARRPGVAVAVATLAKQTGAATLLPVFYLLREATRPARGRRGRGRLPGPDRWWSRCCVGPRQLFYWTVLGNGSYVGLKTASALVARDVRAHDDRLGRVQHPDPVDAAALVARPARTSPTTATPTPTCGCGSLSGAVSVAVGLRFFGHYYLQLVPPLVPAHGRRAAARDRAAP